MLRTHVKWSTSRDCVFTQPSAASDAASGTAPWPPAHPSSDGSLLSTLIETVCSDRYPPGHTTTARCQTLPSREDYHSVGMKPYNYFYYSLHAVLRILRKNDSIAYAMCGRAATCGRGGTLNQDCPAAARSHDREGPLHEQATTASSTSTCQFN